MIAIISTEKNSETIQNVLQRSEVCEFGDFTNNMDELFNKIALLKLEYLILDIQVSTQEEEIIEFVQKVRENNSNRIIVVAENRQPGDTLLGYLFFEGIYDFVCFEEGNLEELAFYLGKIINREYHISHGTKYRIPYNQTLKTKPIKTERSKVVNIINKEVIIDEKIVYRDRIVGRVNIMVSGVDRRTGTTLLALDITRYLISKGYKVAYIEYCSAKPIVEIIKDIEEDEFPIYQADNVQELIKVQAKDYQYYVIDTGELLDEKLEEKYAEFLRADIHFLTIGAEIWDSVRAIKTLNELKRSGFEKQIHFIVNTYSNSKFSEVKELFSKKEQKEFNFSISQHILQHKKNKKIFANLLQPVLIKKDFLGFIRR